MKVITLFGYNILKHIKGISENKKLNNFFYQYIAIKLIELDMGNWSSTYI